MPIKHTFVSAVAEGADATLVRPSNWNADHDGTNDHTHTGTGDGGSLSFGASAFTELTDVPAAYTGGGGKLVKVKATEDGLEFAASTAGSGDVVGPVVAVDGNMAVFDGTTGKLIKDGGAISAGGVDVLGMQVFS